MPNITGTRQKDTLLGTPGNDVINGLEDDDILDGVAGDDVVYGGDGNDKLYGRDGNDVLYGDAGDDYLNGGEGLDTLYGGDGNDKLSKYLSGGDSKLYGGAGDDEIWGGDGNDLIDGGDGNDTWLEGYAGNDVILGGAGNDELYGDAGNDSLDGGPGADQMNGGEGNDTYYIDNIADYVNDLSGTDVANVAVSFVKLPSTIEKINYLNGAMPLPYWIDALLPDEAAGLFFKTILGTDKTYLYAFPTSLPSYDTSSVDAAGYTAFSATQIAQAEAALSYIATLIDVKFVKTTTPATLNTLSFANNQQTSSAGYAIQPTESFRGSDLFFDIDTNNAKFADGTYGALTLIHEIGHAIGLKHPFAAQQAGGGLADPPFLPTSEDRTAWTVMSYNDSRTEYHLQFSPLDIAALQYLYGPSPKARAGNDTYRVLDTTSNFIWDGAGTDTLDLSGVRQGGTIYLTPGYWGYIGTAAASTITAPGQVTVNFGTQIENLVGSSYADKLYGNELDNTISGGGGNDYLEGRAGNDTLTGGAGNDILLGGDGLDVATWTNSLANYKITKTATGYQVLDASGVNGTDDVSQIETLRFSDKTINLGVQAKASAISVSKVTQLAELYISFFNRVPDADGMSYWIDQLNGGQNFIQIAESFYNSGVAYSKLTGFTSTMSNADFINVIYKNVLGRKDGADAGGLAFWEASLKAGQATRGSLVSDILKSAHTFKGNATWGWVADLLDNKISVATQFSINWGLNYNTPEESIQQGMAIAAAITPTDTKAAIALIGVPEGNLYLG